MTEARVSWLEAFKVAALIYVPVRLVIFGFVAGLKWFAPGIFLPLRVDLMARWSIPLPTGAAAELLLNPWLRFDALWYLKIARGGYDLAEPNIHHLPLYPLLIRLLHQTGGLNLAASGLLVSNLAFVAALACFYRLARLDYNASVGRRAAFYLAIFPTAFFYLAGYTESLFLLGSVAAFYYARRQDWALSGGWGAISALARPQGGLILLPLALEFWLAEKPQLTRRWFKAWPLALILAGVGGYALYVQLKFGLRPALAADMAYWQMSQNWQPGLAVWLNIKAIGQGIHPVNNSLDLAFALFGLAMTVWAFAALRPAYGLFMALNLLMVISRPIAEYPLLSLPRFVLPLFPMYILLGQAGQNSPKIHRAILYTSLVLLLFFSAQFAMGGWVA